MWCFHHVSCFVIAKHLKFYELLLVTLHFNPFALYKDYIIKNYLQVIYLLTLFPHGMSDDQQSGGYEQDEHTPLLSSTFPSYGRYINKFFRLFLIIS